MTYKVFLFCDSMLQAKTEGRKTHLLSTSTNDRSSQFEKLHKPSEGQQLVLLINLTWFVYLMVLIKVSTASRGREGTHNAYPLVHIL